MKRFQTHVVPPRVLMECAAGIPCSAAVLWILLALLWTGCGTPLLPETGAPPTSLAVMIPPLPAVYQDWAVQWNITWWDGSRIRRQTKSAGADATISVSIKPASNGAE